MIAFAVHASRNNHENPTGHPCPTISPRSRSTGLRQPRLAAASRLLPESSSAAVTRPRDSPRLESDPATLNTGIERVEDPRVLIDRPHKSKLAELRFTDAGHDPSCLAWNHSVCGRRGATPLTPTRRAAWPRLPALGAITCTTRAPIVVRLSNMVRKAGKHRRERDRVLLAIPDRVLVGWCEHPDRLGHITVPWERAVTAQVGSQDVGQHD